jgi:predicted small lipoprotein YifL
MSRALLALLALTLLAACGRAGPPRPPGPPEAVTYPRIYPAPDPVLPPAARP